jgi:hypothetical protein
MQVTLRDREADDAEKDERNGRRGPAGEMVGAPAFRDGQGEDEKATPEGREAAEEQRGVLSPGEQSLVGNQAPHVTDVDAEVVCNGLDVDEVRHRRAISSWIIVSAIWVSSRLVHGFPRTIGALRGGIRQRKSRAERAPQGRPIGPPLVLRHPSFTTWRASRQYQTGQS